jgi:hypothetical protein
MEGVGRLAQRIPARLSPAEGRKFALTVGAAFLVLAGLSWWRGHVRPPLVLGSLGLTLSLAGLLVPGRLGPVYRFWMGLARVLSRVTTPIFMGIVYYLVLTPIGLALRAVGRNPLQRRGSGWVRRDQVRSDLERQF